MALILFAIKIPTGIFIWNLEDDLKVYLKEYMSQTTGDIFTKVVITEGHCTARR